MDEFKQIESSQRQHNENVEHQVRMDILCSEQQYKRFAMLRPRIFKDGDKWCVLYGDNIQDGVAGFGDTPHEAVIDWENNWYN